MRAEDAWPGQNFDDRDRRHGGLASMNARGPRLATSDGMPVLPGLPGGPAMPEEDEQIIETADGGVIVRLGGPELLADDDEGYEPDDSFYDNLAERMDESSLAEVAEELLEGIEADIQSRAVWMADYERGMGVIGTQLKQPKSQATGEGVSVVDHPLLLEACILYQSGASAELLPAEGPVKIDNGGQQTAITDEDAIQLEKDMNEYLTVHRPEYVPDTERMLFQQGFGGVGIKKGFHCPLRRAPVVDAIAPGDFIVDNEATSLENAGRKTHRIKMRQSVMKRMMYVGAYRDVDLQLPMSDITGIERKTAQMHGIKPQADRQQDVSHTVYECCCEIDMPGDRHMARGKPTGLPRPYIVTIEKDSRQVLEIRRNWVDGDDLFTERRRFSIYSFIPMFGFYASGLLNVLGNTTSALTAGWRIMLDKGMFSNFPGGMYLKQGNRQLDNNFRASPGEFVGIDGGGTDDIRKIISAYPYTEPGASTQAMFKDVETTGQRVGGTANIPVAEGKADTPVGTMLAALEQTSKMISAVHRRGHQAQSVEFQILLELIREKPEDFVKYFEKEGFWTVDRLRRALDNWSLIPRADPNTPTQMHRLLKMMALKQLQQLSPELYNARKVDERILMVLGIDEPEELFAPAQAAPQMPPDPSLAIAQIVAQTEALKTASKEKVEMMKGQLKQIELAIKQGVEAAKVDATREKTAQTAQTAAEGEEAETGRELLRIGAQADQHAMDQRQAADQAAMDREHQASTQAADMRHTADQAAADREHQASESQASRAGAMQIAKMKPKPGGAKKK